MSLNFSRDPRHQAEILMQVDYLEQRAKQEREYRANGKLVLGKVLEEFQSSQEGKALMQFFGASSSWLQIGNYWNAGLLGRYRLTLGLKHDGLFVHASRMSFDREVIQTHKPYRGLRLLQNLVEQGCTEASLRLFLVAVVESVAGHSTHPAIYRIGQYPRTFKTFWPRMP